MEINRYEGFTIAILIEKIRGNQGKKLGFEFLVNLGLGFETETTHMPKYLVLYCVCMCGKMGQEVPKKKGRKRLCFLTFHK